MITLIKLDNAEADGTERGISYYTFDHAGNRLQAVYGMWYENDDEDTSQEETWEYSSVQEAIRAYADKIIEKLDNGYQEVVDDEDCDNDDDIEDEDDAEDDEEGYHSVRTVDEIREQIAKFNQALQETAIKDSWIGQKLRSSRYWVCDSRTGNFGLGKLVGYYPVDPVEYTNGTVKITGPWMDGGSAKNKIESVTGKTFQTSDDTLKSFHQWVKSSLLANAADDLDYQKLKFLTI
jgi:hypothetical protein